MTLPRAGCWAVVPLKDLRQAKQRLEPVLQPDERRELVLRMFADVLAALRGVHGLAGIAVVSRDPELVPSDLLWIEDPGSGLNGAIAAAARQLELRGAAAMLAIHGDVPFVKAAEIEALLHAGETTPVVIAPDRLRQGTNALFLRPSTLFATQFGIDSLPRHVAAAEAVGITPHICDLPGFGFDVDLPQDLEELRQRQNAYYLGS
jgi:2-phospho-L-lactate guanylyltransferase